MRPIMRHADHDPTLICRPAFGHGLCEPLLAADGPRVVSGPETQEHTRDNVQRGAREAGKRKTVDPQEATEGGRSGGGEPA